MAAERLFSRNDWYPGWVERHGISEDHSCSLALCPVDMAPEWTNDQWISGFEFPVA